MHTIKLDVTCDFVSYTTIFSKELKGSCDKAINGFIGLQDKHKDCEFSILYCTCGTICFGKFFKIDMTKEKWNELFNVQKQFINVNA